LETLSISESQGYRCLIKPIKQKINMLKLVVNENVCTYVLLWTLFDPQYFIEGLDIYNNAE